MMSATLKETGAGRDAATTADAAAAALPKTLEEFVERAIADTPGLSPEGAEVIRQRVSPWYVYYRRNAPWIVDALDFAEDNDEIRWLQQYFRETLAGYLTGFYNLEHIYFSVEMVYIGYLEEFVRIEREKEARKTRELREQEFEPAPSLLTLVEPDAQARPGKKAGKAQPPDAEPQSGFEQFGLFG